MTPLAPQERRNPASHKLWGGRFSGGPRPALDAVNRSIGVDFRLWPFDVRLSKAWAAALAHAGVSTAREGAQLAKGLDAVAARIAGGEKPIATDEDVHTMIDRLLHEEAGARRVPSSHRPEPQRSGGDRHASLDDGSVRRARRR